MTRIFHSAVVGVGTAVTLTAIVNLVDNPRYAAVLGFSLGLLFVLALIIPGLLELERLARES